MKRFLLGLLLVIGSGLLIAQAQAACDASGRQVVARRWDVVLGHEWEMVRDCRHPEWPARAQTVKGLLGRPSSVSIQASSAPAKEPVIIRAGDIVKLWQHAAFVRMEMSGVAEQAARRGERIEIRVIHHNDDGSSTTARIAGTARAAGDVEMDQ